MTPINNLESWADYRRLVLDCISENKTRVEDLEDRLAKIDTEISLIKLKIGMVAGIAGFIGSLIPVLVQFFLSKL